MKQILTPPVLKIITALKEAGETRIVGGAVRDAVMQRAIGDIDMATTVLPQHMMEILPRHGIKCVPTGLAHGTITAVVDHVGYEITTLRRDVATDGRHATVAFTDDWQSDAARRDFTFNALSMDEAGKIFDYFNGINDALAGRVYFIGDADARIREDVLRILRFFRFNAWFGNTMDETGLNACRANATLIPTLSAERVAKETLKLLAAPNPAPIWDIMLQNNIAQHISPNAINIQRLSSLTQQNDGLLALAALLPEDETIAAATAARLKLSNKDTEALTSLAKLPALLRNSLTPLKVRPLLYRFGANICRRALPLTGENTTDAAQIIAAWENPLFPIRGEDLLRLGIPAGKQIGDILNTIENWWIAHDFRPSRADCLAQIPYIGKNH
jgi:poly(A) polymerase